MKFGLAFTLLSLALALFTLAGSDVGTVSASGTGKVNFFMTSSGSPTVEGSCSATDHGGIWPTYGFDGAVGFPTNLPGGSNTQITPTAALGTLYMCVNLVMSGQSTTVDSYAIHISGQTITSNYATCSTTSTGSGATDCWFILTLSVSSGCLTNPIMISPKVSGAGGGGTQIQHIANLYYDNDSCLPPNSTPEFPLGLVGVFALVLPGLLILRRRTLGSGRVSRLGGKGRLE